MDAKTCHLDMSPSKPLENLVNSPTMNFKLPSKRPYRATFAMKLPDGENLFVCQLGIRVFFAKRPGFQSAFYSRIMYIVFRSTFKKVVGVSANSPITRVTDKEC